MTDTLLILARIGLGAVFLAAGVAKLIDRAEFEKHLPAFGVKWPGVARGMSYGLPVVEVVIGLMLLVSLNVGFALRLAVVMMLVFTLVVAATLIRHTSISCGCFGNIGRRKVTGGTLMRNILLLSLSVMLLMTSAPSSGSVGASLTLGSTLSLGLILFSQYLRRLNGLFR